MNQNHHLPTIKEQNLQVTFPGKPNFPGKIFTSDSWFDDACIVDTDYFVKTLAGIKAKGVRPDLVASIITHYACKWLPDLAGGIAGEPSGENPGESVTVSWMKKRFFVETLVGAFPPENDALPCNFLLRLLRTASMVGVEPACRGELERRTARQLDGASLREMMIPSFSHTCGTLLDVALVQRLVERFVAGDDTGKTGVAAVKVAKLVDSYLAEAAVDAGLAVTEFVALAEALPGHARAFDDGLYRAIDTYLKAHPSASKDDRRSLCRLIDSRKLSPEASMHAAQNERLPIRAVIQILFSEQSKLSRCLTDWSGSFSATRSPNFTSGPASDTAPRCQSKREASAQQVEIRRLKDDVARLQSQLSGVQAQLERVLIVDHHRKSQQTRSGGFFGWKRLGFLPGSVKSSSTRASNSVAGQRETPTVNAKTKLVRGGTPSKWRKSVS